MPPPPCIAGPSISYPRKAHMLLLCFTFLPITSIKTCNLFLLEIPQTTSFVIVNNKIKYVTDQYHEC